MARLKKQEFLNYKHKIIRYTCNLDFLSIRVGSKFHILMIVKVKISLKFEIVSKYRHWTHLNYISPARQMHEDIEPSMEILLCMGVGPIQTKQV